MKCTECNGRKFIEKAHGIVMSPCEACNGTGEIDDSNSGTGQDNQPAGKPDTGKPVSNRKPKAGKTARKRA